jgi:DNA-binding GntR family transcriptional regulator
MVEPTREPTMPPQMPYTRRIVIDIQGKITSGEWPPGHKLPSIRDLAKTYGCSSAPVRVALSELQGAGVIVGHQGVGNFVAPVGT